MKKILMSLFVIGCFLTSSIRVTNADLIAHYEFEGNFDDTSGHGNHGAGIGDATTIWDVGGNGKSASNVLRLDGDGDYVEVPDAPTLNFGTGDFTVSLWVNYESLSGQQILIEKFVEYSSGWTLMKLGQDQGNIIGFAARIGPGLDPDEYFEMDAVVPLLDSQIWHRVAVTRSTNVFTISFDGEPIQSGNCDFNLNSPATLKIGRRGDERGYFTNGLIDDVQITPEPATVLLLGLGGLALLRNRKK